MSPPLHAVKECLLFAFRMFTAVRYIFGLLIVFMSMDASALDPDDSKVEMGRLIYQAGILPNGEPLRVLRPEGFVMEGRHAACVICHRRSGMGSVEGSIDTTILVPPVVGSVLFTPARFATNPLDLSHHYVPNEAWERALTRPAYDIHSLARALRVGLDPGGRKLVSPMPRYGLDDEAVEALGAYLGTLSSSPAPGVEADALHLATVVTPDARPEHSEAVLEVLHEWSNSARGSGTPWHLHVWKLSGPSDTWADQLEAYHMKHPVFALLSGVGSSEWAPVHHFCEHNGVPCILPSVEVAPEPGDGWYSMYFSPGVGLEAEILARYLDANTIAVESEQNIIQVYSDASGRHASEALRARLNTGAGFVSSRRFRMTSPRSILKGISSGDLLVLWLRPDEISQLALEMPRGPGAGTVLVSAFLAPPQELSLPSAWKEQIRFVSLFDDASVQGEIARLRLERWLNLVGLADNQNRRLQADTYAACYLFNKALGEIRQQEVRRPVVHISREHVLEILETLVNKYSDSTDLVDTDSHVAYYGRMSLGPNQRVAVRGGTVMRYASTDSNKLIHVGSRIIP